MTKAVIRSYICCFATALLLFSTSSAPAAEPALDLTVGEGFRNPMGFHDPTLRFSWKLPKGVTKQTAYQIAVARGLDRWDSGWVESDQSVLVPYKGRPFTSRDKGCWKVRYRDQDGNESDWSDFARFEMGLLSNDDWQAKWIRPQKESNPKQEPVAWLRKKFAIDGGIWQARLYITARGLFDAKLNGKRVGKDYFANGWTSYKNRIDTLMYDVTDTVTDGDNELVVALGKGWYAGRLAWKDAYAHYGPNPELLLQLEVTTKDRKKIVVTSDESWQGTWQGPIESSSIYDGEHYDATQPITGWKPVVANADLGSAKLTPKPFAPVRVTEELSPQAITEPEPGKFVFDLGQNMVGVPRLKLPVEKGQTVALRFAEMLNPDGTLYTENYRSAKAVATYKAAQTDTIEWQPTFTFYGFRYIELSGLAKDAEPQTDWVTGLVMHSDLKPTGTFLSSHDKLNRLASNIRWGQRGNFLDIPTDCPQRDERLGWTGDAQVFCPTAMFHYDCHAFFKSWLESMRHDQYANGTIPHVIPDCLNAGNSPGWMDAATIVPWEVYVRSGDTEVLAENLEMMEKLVGLYRSKAKDGLITKIAAFGDWLQPYAKTNKGETPAPLLGTAYYARSATILSDSARVLGKAELADKYAAEAAMVRKAFAKHYFDAEGKLQNAPETQTAYVLALACDLIPDELREAAAANLKRLVHEADNHLRTGFLGTAHLVRVLDEAGYDELAYELLLKESYPSWFYSINQGATTMWERWNSYSHQDGFGDAGMNSFNHYAYGAIGQWMTERVAGLEPDPQEPGYKHIIIQPLVEGPLEHARAELETHYGKAVSGWMKQEGKVVIEVVVPPNATATFYPPASSAADITVNGVAVEKQAGVEIAGDTSEQVQLKLAPGEYLFGMRLPGSKQ